MSLNYISAADTQARQLEKLLVLSKRPCDFVCCHKIPDYVDYLRDPEGVRAAYANNLYGMNAAVPQKAVAALMPQLWTAFGEIISTKIGE